MGRGADVRLRSAPALLGRLVGGTAICIALTGLFVLPAQADPYPPTPPCALSFTSSISGNTTATLIGSGLGDQQPVSVVLYPQTTTLGSWVTDGSGSFQAQVDLPQASTEQATWLTATTNFDSCSTPTPKGPSSGGGTSTSPATPTGGSTGSSGADGSGNGSVGVDGGSAPSGANAAGPSTSAGPSSDRSGGAPTSSSAVSPPATPAQSSGANRSPRPIADVQTDLGLPTSVIITIAVLLLLAGGLAVIFLTRRAG